MRDRKALQAGTSHMLGQNFAQCRGHRVPRPRQRAQAPLRHVAGASRPAWSGATIMAHGDDCGLVLPPNVAPHAARHRAHLPERGGPRGRRGRRRAAGSARSRDVQTASGPLRLKVDWREESPGFKFNHWELRGVPLRLEIGPRDVAAGQVVLVRRMDRAKETCRSTRCRRAAARLAAYQAAVFQRALDFRAEHTHDVDDYGRFREIARGPGRLPDGPLVRLGRVRAAGQRGDRRDHPGHPVRLARRAGACIVDGRPSSDSASSSPAPTSSGGPGGAWRAIKAAAPGKARAHGGPGACLLGGLAPHAEASRTRERVYFPRHPIRPPRNVGDPHVFL